MYYIIKKNITIIIKKEQIKHLITNVIVITFIIKKEAIDLEIKY